MPKCRTRKNTGPQRHQQTHRLYFTAEDDNRLREAYNYCKADKSRGFWGRVEEKYKELLRRDPKLKDSPRLKKVLSSVTEKRLRERYLNHVQPNVRATYDSSFDSADTAMLIRCINLAIERGLATNDRKYSVFSTIWKELSPSDFLSDNAIKNLAGRLRELGFLKHNGTHYYLAEDSPSPTAAPSSDGSSSPAPGFIFDSGLDLLDLDLDLGRSAELDLREEELNRRAAEQTALQSELEKLKATLAQQAEALATEKVSLGNKGTGLKAQELALFQEREDLQLRKARFKTAAQEIQTGLRATALQLNSKKKLLNAREKDLDRREAALATAPKTDESRADSAAPSGLQWTF